MTPPKPARQGKHALTVWGMIALFCLAALVGTFLLFVKAPPPRKIVIATGGKAGAYHQFADRYAAALAKEGLTLEVRATAGSVENLPIDLHATWITTPSSRPSVRAPSQGRHPC